ncbi:MAG TPA: NAD(P)/FAD-dependent oxidoreductase [Sulfolobales archaeon]|nr:NAD(P)/FAD-dependent oxidoreductase [Sulfolobales archaeon]
MFDVVVIGAGHNGLTAAIVLAMKGLDVAIIDHLPWYGGMSGSKWLAGSRIPVGAYVVGLVPERILRAVGVRLRRFYPDPIAVYVHGDTIIRWWFDLDKRFHELESIGASDVKEMWGSIAGFHRSLERYLLTVDPPSIQELLSDPVLEWFVKKSSRDLLARYLPPWLWSMFIPDFYLDQPAFLVGYYNPPEGWFFPENSGGRGAWVLVDELFRRAIEEGVKIYLGIGVSRILVEDGKARGVILDDGSRVEARYVISTASPANTLIDMLDPGIIDEDTIKRLEKGSPMTGVRRIAVILREKPRLADCLEPYRESIIQTPRGEVVVIGNSVIATGGFGLEDLEELILNIRRDAKALEIMDARDLESVFRVRGGNVNHIIMTQDYLFNCRPVCGWGYRTPIGGLYLGGAGTWPGGQLTCIPGWNAAHRLLSDSKNGSR